MTKHDYILGDMALESVKRYLWIGYYAHKALFYLQRAPSFGEDHIRQLILKCDTESAQRTGREFIALDGFSEMDHFKRNSARNARYWSTLLVWAYLVHLAKDMIIQFIDYGLIDRKNLQSNIVQFYQAGNPDASHRYSLLTKFSCLVTNCTRLSLENTLLLDMSKLPFFKLCEPNLSRYYGSANIIDPIALLTFTVIALGAVSAGVFLPLWNLIAPLPHYVFMFILAPTVVTNALKAHLSILLDDLNQSWYNYATDYSSSSSITTMQYDPDFQTPSEVEYEFPAAYLRNSKDSIGSVATIASTITTRTSVGYRPSINRIDRNKLVRDYLDECLPAIRTDWWRIKLARSLLYVIIFTAIVILGTSGSVLYFIENRARQMRSLYKRFAIRMSNDGCSIWSDLYDDFAQGIQHRLV